MSQNVNHQAAAETSVSASTLGHDSANGHRDGKSDRIATADLYDERGDELQSVSLQFQTVGGREHFHGPIRSIRCSGDNGLVKSLTATQGDGAVLVVDAQGSLESAMMGGNIAQAAVRNGWAGVIINGAVRDRAEIGALDLGVKALGSNPRKSRKDGAGEVDVELSFGGATFRPGAMVYCDDDGILVER
ncbi:ribonuclease E activity regulator RraA [Kocuria sp.]|uniref:ribonuclease E activity regulator RraA n=1 Tax=Kocuria sp. TaxID=1871328 RepID=UPI003F8D18F6